MPEKANHHELTHHELTHHELTHHELKLTLQFPDKLLQKQLTKKLLKKVVQAALCESTATAADITLRFVSAEEGRTLNREYRGKDYATNVLTFAYGEENIHADIILCVDVLQQEAAAQNKSILDHTLHLIVHGVLHARGFDHEEEEEATEMESLESTILATLGVKNPYA